LRFSKHIFGVTCLLSLALFCSAQSGGQVRLKKILVSADTISLDSLSLIPGTIQLSVQGKILDTASYSILYSQGKIVFKTRPADTLMARYKAFPYLFTQTHKHKDIALLHPDNRGIFNPYVYSATGGDADIFRMEGLTKSGSISRGVSFGNSQDLSVNSSLNLQLSGKLSNDVDILLAASDQNIPIQPQGNTQNLQEFDKVFIQLSNKTSKLIAGDFMVTKPTGYFLNYNKKAQGVGVSTVFGTAMEAKDTVGQGHMRVSLSAAISKGKFGRQELVGVEGNQGPYILRGNENEPFIIILSGSEKVYIDGQLMKRGQEYDYIIDYNTAQVTFTARNLITKDKRVIVEFQYSDKNYARSIVNFSDDYVKKDLRVHFNVYSEQDSKNQPLQQSLNDQQKLLLHNIGDTISKAFYPAVDSVAWSNSLVLYRRPVHGDTLVGGVVYPGVFVYSNDPVVSHFQLSFSNMGQGNGDYINIPSSANGRVFQWVAPIGGVHQGSYAPVILLVTPKKKQMVTLGGEYKLNKNTSLMMEGALSDYNQNTFSPYDHDHDVGEAFKLIFNNKTVIWSDKTDTAALHKAEKAYEREYKGKSNAPTFDPVQALETKWIFDKTLNYEFTQHDFSPIERYKAVEFDRDWNTGTLPFVSDQHILSAGVIASRTHYGSLGYTAGSLIEGSEYSGLRNAVTGLFSHKGYVVKTDISLLESKGLVNNTQFLRHKADVSKHFRKITLGVFEQQERNMLRSAQGDSVAAASFNYFEWQAYAENADTVKNRYRVSYKQRRDFGVMQNQFSPLSYAQDMGFSVALVKNRKSQLKTNLTYRELQVLNPALTTTKPENSLVGRIDYNLRLWNGLLVSGTFYEAGSGLEQKKQYSYVQVPAGQGQYTWVDYNGDGIKQLNEFEIALFPDQATYIRVFTPTDQYIKAFTNQFSQNLLIKPAALWANKTGLKKMLSYFSEQATYRVDRKTTDQHPEEAYNPFLKSILDTALVTLNSSFRNSVFFNQNDPVFGVDMNFQDVRNKSLLTTGFESRVNDFYELRVRWNMNKTFGLILTGKDGEKSNTSQYFTSRNYQLTYLTPEAKLTVQPNLKFRVSLDYVYTEKKNNPENGAETVYSNNLGGELKYNILTKGSINLKLNYIQMNYNGSPNSAVAYEMLDGLKSGKNATWSVSYQRTLSNNIQVNITYDGRQSENSKMIHTGGASVRAFF
jgi:hypothetical protein